MYFNHSSFCLQRIEHHVIFWRNEKYEYVQQIFLCIGNCDIFLMYLLMGKWTWKFRKYTVVILVQLNIHGKFREFCEPESQRYIYGVPYPFLSAYTVYSTCDTVYRSYRLHTLYKLMYCTVSAKNCARKKTAPLFIWPARRLKKIVLSYKMDSSLPSKRKFPIFCILILCIIYYC
jgi:hypothetical protein